MTNRTADCALLIILAITILFFVGSKMMINNCLDRLNEFRMEAQMDKNMETEIKHSYETIA